MNELLNEKQVAKRLVVSIKTLQQWRWQGKGPPYRKLGGFSVRYDPDELWAWVTQEAHQYPRGE